MSVCDLDEFEHCLVEYYTVFPRVICSKVNDALQKIFKHGSRIGVNAAGVATPQYLTCMGRPVSTTPQYFYKCFIFFPSTELLNTASRCHFHLQCSRLVARSTKCKASALAHARVEKIHKFSGKGHVQPVVYC